jgi:hypothetical protein
MDVREKQLFADKIVSLVFINYKMLFEKVCEKMRICRINKSVFLISCNCWMVGDTCMKFRVKIDYMNQLHPISHIMENSVQASQGGIKILYMQARIVIYRETDITNLTLTNPPSPTWHYFCVCSKTTCLACIYGISAQMS